MLKFDITVNVLVEVSLDKLAVRLAISRAICELDAENRGILKPEGLLTRDPRMVERKKFDRRKLVRNSNSLNNIKKNLTRFCCP